MSRKCLLSSLTLSLHILDPSAEETNSRGFDRTGIARLMKKDEKRKKEKKNLKKIGQIRLFDHYEVAFRQWFRAL